MRKSVLILPLAVLLLWGALTAQERLITRNGEARVPIFEDDLDDARLRAVRLAQDAVVREALRSLVAPEWLRLYQGDLKRRILSRLDRYISSYRIRKLETSLDRTQYYAALEAQVDRPALVADLRELSLPILGDRKRRLSILYPRNDPLLASASVRGAAFAALTARLALLNFDVAAQLAIEARDVSLLASPFTGRMARRALLARIDPGAPAVLVLATRTPADDDQESRTTLSAAFYLVRTGALLANFEQPARNPLPPLSPVTSALVKAVMRSVIEPALVQMQPGRIGEPEAWSAGGESLHLRVLGLRSIYDEETFERDFFRPNSPFEGFVLSRLAENWVSYEGVYRGDRATLESELSGREFGAFRVRRVFWHNETLEMRVQRLPYLENRELVPFPPPLRTPMVAGLFEDLIATHPELEYWGATFAELEDNGRFDRANPIAFGAMVYGYVDSRGDADIFLGDVLQPGEEIEIEWYRLGRTNLQPVIRIYDQRGFLEQTIHLGSAKKFTHTLTGEAFHLEVADRHGYLSWDAGGYLNFHYLLRVWRSGRD